MIAIDSGNIRMESSLD